MLETLVALLAASVVLIPLSRRAGFGSVLGYLVGGAVIGPQGLRLVTNVDEIRELSELGVIMLLFLIGLELRPQRLWVMRKAIFALGPAHFVANAAVIAVLAHMVGVKWPGAIALSWGLALSSTAIVLPLLAERDLLGTGAGRDTFAVLLFQDVAFVPLVALVPLLTGVEVPEHMPWGDVVRGAGAILAILLGGRFLMRPALRAIGGARTPEVFTAFSLLTVIGSATLANVAGLSTSLGAFLGGVLLSDSEYRHEVQADVEPFEGLLLGFFFTSVGMSANLALAASEPVLIAGAVAALLLVKIIISFLLGRLSGQSVRGAVRFALALPQGSEFSFVLFGVALSAGALGQHAADRAMLVVAFSMVATPILFALSERFIVARLGSSPKPAYDKIRNLGTPVIICGFGRVGQIVGRLLKLRGIDFTALERDAGQVEVVRKYGNKVYYGDPTRAEVLRAAGADTARLIVVALDDMEATLRVVEVVRHAFPQAKIIVRARNRRHAHLLMDLKVDGIVRETFHSSLRMSAMALEALDVSSSEARRAVDLFREHDERTLIKTHAVYDDEHQLIQTTQQAAAELAELFEADRREAEQTATTQKPPAQKAHTQKSAPQKATSK
ncbi:MAG TPA: monovalent cation:proton antiporter-2 (CPA2) family protein [Xanthobacteraceae bacterium]|nr:monovalent cation:proton antiporter-2 (CPA2) family protein [Xanthobacteraceae bacterium]